MNSSTPTTLALPSQPDTGSRQQSAHRFLSKTTRRGRTLTQKHHFLLDRLAARTLRFASAGILAVSLMVFACGSPAVSPSGAGAGSANAGGSANGKPRIVASYSILGSLVREMVGDQAEVYVPIPNGLDPHEWEPSAQDAAEFAKAQFIVINGMGLEEGLESTLEQIKTQATPMFEATSAIPTEQHNDSHTGADDHAGEANHDGGADHTGADDHAGETDHDGDAEHGAGTEHDHEGHDPHIWMNPDLMRLVVLELGPRLDAALGIDTRAATANLAARLSDLDAEIGALVASLPAAQRKLVTGHESLGYFAERYGFTLIGTIIPGMSSQAEENAADLAALYRAVKAAGVKAIFTEVGTPESVARGLGSDTGAKLVTLTTHGLPQDGSYFTFMKNLAQTVVQELR